MALGNNRQSMPILVIALAALVGYMAYTGTGINMVGMNGLKVRKARISAIEDTIATLQAQTDSAKRELAKGTVEDLRRRIESHRASLGLLRRLVPERNEVPNLLDDMSTRAKIRGVNLSEVVPLPVEPGPTPFDTHKYNVSVIGRYDEIGEFLSDVASLQRIIVPIDVTLAPANQQAARALADTSGALLQARFQIRTFVKPTEVQGGVSGS